jgi:chromosome segregation ATPase
MSDWGYSDRQQVIKDTKKAAAAVDTTQKELKNLRAEVKMLLESQRKLTEAFTQMSREMQKMREDMYPTSKTTKPALPRPSALPKSHG